VSELFNGSNIVLGCVRFTSVIKSVCPCAVFIYHIYPGYYTHFEVFKQQPLLCTLAYKQYKKYSMSEIAKFGNQQWS
jgi:hypothetical protein